MNFKKFPVLALSAVYLFLGVDTAAAAAKVLCTSRTGQVFARGLCLKGERRFNAGSLPSVLASGQTVRGVIGGAFNSDRVYTVASLPVPGPSPWGEYDVIVVPNDVVLGPCDTAADCINENDITPSPACTGNYDNPTAPAGKCCIYPTGIYNATNVQGLGASDLESRFGIAVQWYAGGGGNFTYFVGNYACTAP